MAKFVNLSLRGLTSQIFTIVVLPLTALLILITFGGLFAHRQAMRTLVGERDERAARAAANALAEQFNHRRLAIQGLAIRAGPGSSEGDLNAVLAESSFLLPDFDEGMAFFDPEGSLLAFIGDAQFWESLGSGGLTDLMATIPAVNTTVFFSFPALSSNGTLKTLTLAPSQSGEVFAAGVFSPTTVAQQTLTGVFSMGAGTFSLVTDAEGRLIFQTGNLPQNAVSSIREEISAVFRGESGASYLEITGAEYVVAYAPVSLMDWELVIAEPWEQVTSPMLRTTEYAPLVLVPAVVLSLIALGFITQRVVRPLQELESKAAELGWGDFETIEEPVGGIVEVRRLQSELVHLARKVQAAQEGLRGYINAITTGQEEERQRLARELHDDTLQSLIALNQRVQLVQMSIDNPAEAAALAEVQALIDEAIQDLRRLTRALRPIYLEDLGLVAALEMLALETEGAGELSVQFKKSGTEQRLPPEEELAFYRIAQEALNNVVRHGEATQTDIKLDYAGEKVSLEVHDNGRGFEVPESPAEFAPSGHYGLLGMHERAELIGARLDIHSSPGQGSTIKVELPH